MQAEATTDIDLDERMLDDLESVRRWGFRSFVELAWPILEPVTAFIPKWCSELRWRGVV